MKMVMIVVDEAKTEELEVALERSGVAGYSEVSRVRGFGSSGPRLDSRAFPGTSSIVLTAVPGEAMEALEREVARFCADCGERLRMFAWDVEELGGAEATGRSAR